MNTSGPVSTQSPSDDTSESSLVEQDTPTSPGGPSVTTPDSQRNEAPADPATGHYGPGYGDPTRHQGNDPPLDNPPARDAGDGRPART